jgi:hypothetical protein
MLDDNKIREWAEKELTDTEAVEKFLSEITANAESLTYECVSSTEPDTNPILNSLDSNLELWQNFQEALITKTEQGYEIEGFSEPIKEQTEETKEELEEGEKKFREMIEERVDSLKVSKMIEAISLPVGETVSKQHILDIGIDNLKTEKFGAFDDEDITKLQILIPELGRLGSFNYNIKLKNLLFDPGNYRLAMDTTVNNLSGTDQKLVDLITIEDIKNSQEQIKKILFDKDKSNSDNHNILTLRRSIKHKGFQREFPLGVVSTKWNEIRKTTDGKVDDPTLIEDIDDLTFVIADGNRRATALRLLIEQVEALTLPKQKQRIEELMKNGIPCVVHLARTQKEADSIRKEIQTNHHRLGQEAWSPFGDAYNLIKRFDEQKALGYPDTYIYKELGREFNIHERAMRYELRALRFLDKAVEKGIIESGQKEEKFGITKDYILKRNVCTFFEFNKSDLDHWPPELTEGTYETFIKYVLTDDTVKQSKASKTGDIVFQQITKAMTSQKEKVRQMLVDEDITSEKLLNISNSTEYSQTGKKLKMIDWLKNTEKQLKNQKWIEDSDILQRWPGSVEKTKLKTTEIEVASLQEKFEVASSRSSGIWKQILNDWASENEALITEEELKTMLYFPHVEICISYLKNEKGEDTAASLEAFIESTSADSVNLQEEENGNEDADSQQSEGDKSDNDAEPKPDLEKAE